MLVVKLEIWPGGDASRARDIGRLEICNVSELAPVSDYTYEIYDGNMGVGGIVKEHKRSDGAWRLVCRVLKEALRRGWQ